MFIGRLEALALRTVAIDATVRCDAQRSAIASSLSFDSTTRRVGSMRTAPSRSKPFSSWLTRWREAPSSWAMSSWASCRPIRISSPCCDAVAARQQQDLLGQARRERPRVEVLDGVEQQAQAPAVQAQQRLVQLDVQRQQVPEVGLAHDQQRGRAVRMRVVGARHAVEQGDVAEPGAGLDVGERDLLARERHRAHAHRAVGDAAPFLGRRAARREDRAVGEPAHHGARQDRLAQRLGKAWRTTSPFRCSTVRRL